MSNNVYFCKETFEDGSDEIITLCNECIPNNQNIEKIDLAGKFDICCSCGNQNVSDEWKTPQLSEYQLIDKEIAESTPCNICQGQCEYDKVRENDRYIAISRCTECGHVVEF